MDRYILTWCESGQFSSKELHWFTSVRIWTLSLSNMPFIFTTARCCYWYKPEVECMPNITTISKSKPRNKTQRNMLNLFLPNKNMLGGVIHSDTCRNLRKGKGPLTKNQDRMNLWDFSLKRSRGMEGEKAWPSTCWRSVTVSCSTVRFWKSESCGNHNKWFLITAARQQASDFSDTSISHAELSPH